ncbi:MAG: hypothetical protein KJS97_00075 [Alphaproteobacteria bacterium]|nr:hypothetical protein [Alphaproteobacteria bacterium]
MEIGVSLAVLVALDRLVFHGALATLAPHPFWIIVLFAAVQYGAWGGAIGAAAASLALYARGVPHRGAEDFFEYTSTILALPAMWLLAAVAFGGLRSLHIRKLRALEARLDETLSHANTIATGFTRACGEIKRLEARIASDTATVNTIIRDIAAIGAGGRDTVRQSLSAFAQHCLGTPNITIWIFSSDPAAADGTLDGLELSQDVTTTLFEQRRAAVIAGLPDDIAVAAPIVAADDISGLLIVWRIDDLSPTDAAHLGRRAELLGLALGVLLEPQLSPSPVVAFHPAFKRVSRES